MKTAFENLNIRASFPPPPAMKRYSSENYQTWRGLPSSSPLPPFHAATSTVGLKTTITLSDASPPSARDQSRVCTSRTLFEHRWQTERSWICVGSDARVCSLYNTYLFFGFSNFWMQEFSISHVSVAPPRPAVAVSR